MNRVCAVVPVYNHPDTIVAVVDYLADDAGLPVFLIDDGSDMACKSVLKRIATNYPDAVTLITRARNGGKGAAVQTGLRRSYRMGFSHAVQVDADGQHDLSVLPRFLEAAEEHPEAIISGKPKFIKAPLGRRFGRYLTHIWVWINTLSFEIVDAMCGFRVYPVEPVMHLLEQHRIGRRMDFDPEILVRMHWRGTKIIQIPVNVRYPKDGVSHFRLWGDNFAITRMHTRLFFGMLKRIPVIMWRRRRRRRLPGVD